MLDADELKRIIAEGQAMPLEDKVSIMAQVCDGSRYAYRKGIGHRDIQPGNIMLLSSGQVRIFDVGIGRIATTERSLTRTGLITGTRHYVAPEQVQGRSSHRSDKDPRTRARRPPAPRNGAIGG